MAFLDILAVCLFRRFPALETRLKDGAFETCARTFRPPHPGSSLLHPHLLPFLFTELRLFSFKLLFLQLVCLTWQWSPLMLFFPPTPCYGNGDGPKAIQAHRRVGSDQHRAKRGFSKCGSQSHDVTGDIRAACKYIQMTEGISHRVGFPISLVHPVMVPFFGGWSLFMSDTSLTSKSAGVKKRWEALANTGITSTPSIFSPFLA